MNVKGPVSTTSPAVVLIDVSGSSGWPPRSCAARKVDGTLALSTSCSVSGSIVVCTFSVFCWPGVGARKPVLTPPRTEISSVRP